MSDTPDSELASPPGILKRSKQEAKSATDAGDSILQRSLHVIPFKLRFAPRRDIGRSYVSLVKPLGLEATVTPKFHTQKGKGEVKEEHVECVFARIQDKFKLGPREKYGAPVTTAQVYGWWWDRAPPIPKDRRLQHHIQDSYWLKSRIAVLAADKKLK